MLILLRSFRQLEMTSNTLAAVMYDAEDFCFYF